VAPAIACGCPVVAKPSERTPLTAHLLGDAISHGLAQVDLPADAISILPALPPEAGPLVDDERVKVLSVTGGAATGWKLKERASKKQVILELGGDGAVIVWGDAEVDAAVSKCALASFAYAGQVCISVQRIYVDARAYPAFRDRFLAAARAFERGDPRDPNVVIGPMIDDAAAERIDQWVEEAIGAGARLLLREPRKGRMMGPIVLESVPPSCKLGCEEAFGPVVYLEPVEHFDEALARVNASPYGLQAGLFTDGLARVEAAFERLEVGALIVNDTPMWRIDSMPYGGVKESGFGREGIRYAIEAYTEPRLMVIAPGEGSPDLDR
jgi:acyl-CoA reductase-like NAD-dependent aldehyde dehydrogenase